MHTLTTARLVLKPWEDAFGEDLARLASDERDAAGRAGEPVRVYILDRPDWQTSLTPAAVTGQDRDGYTGNQPR